MNRFIQRPKSLVGQLILSLSLLAGIAGLVTLAVAALTARDALRDAAFVRLNTAYTWKFTEIDNWLDTQSDYILTLGQQQTIERDAVPLLREFSAGLPPDATISSLAYSPDGELLVSAGVDGYLRSWSVTTGLPQQAISTPYNPAHVAWSPDESAWVVSERSSSTAWIYLLADSNNPYRLDLDGIATYLAFTADGQYAVIATDHGSVTLWSLADGSQHTHQLTTGASVREISIGGPDGTWIAAASEDKHTYLWDWQRGEVVHKLAHDNWVIRVTISPDGRWVAAGDADAHVIVWDSADGSEVMRFEHNGWIRGIVFDPNMQWVATGSEDRLVKVWNLADQSLIHTLEHSDPLRWMIFNEPTGQLAVRSLNSRTVSIWNVSTGEKVSDVTQNESISAIAVHPDGTSMAIGDRHQGTIWYADAREQTTFHHNSIHQRRLESTFTTFANSSDDLVSIHLVDPSGKVIVRSQPAQFVFPNHSDTPWVANGPSFTPLDVELSAYEVTDGSRVYFTAATNVTDPDTGEYLGLLVSFLNWDRLAIILNSDSRRTVTDDGGLGETGRTYIVLNSGRPFPDQPDGPILNSPGIDEARAGEDAAATYSDSADKTVFGSYGPIENLDVVLMAEINRAEALESANLLMGILLGLFALIALGIAYSTRWLAQQIARPILTLTEAAADIEKGDYHKQDDVLAIAEREDEIGTLAGVFARMTKAVDSREKNLKTRVQTLSIEIDEAKGMKQAREIMSTDFFRGLEQAAKTARKRRNRRRSKKEQD